MYSLYKYHAYSVRCLRNQAFVPTVSKGSVLDIKNTTATYNGNVTNDGGASVTARGVCWSTSSNPTIADAHTSNGTGTGTFTSNITGLLPNTTYYVRAYATNSSGTAYSTVTSFRTLTACNGVPTVTDIDGNVYNTVKIGQQCWMRENMKTTRYGNLRSAV